MAAPGATGGTPVVPEGAGGGTSQVYKGTGVMVKGE